MTVRKDDDDLAAALQRVQQRGLGAKTPRRLKSLREAEAIIVDLAMVVLWPRQAAARGNSEAAENMFKIAIIDELRGKSKLAQLLRALYDVNELELDPRWAAKVAYIKARENGRLNNDSAYEAAAYQLSLPDAAGRRKQVKGATVKRNVMFVNEDSGGKGVAWMYGGKATSRVKHRKKDG